MNILTEKKDLQAGKFALMSPEWTKPGRPGQRNLPYGEKKLGGIQMNTENLKIQENYYESAYEYAKNVDISSFKYSGYMEKERFVFEFTLDDEVEFCDNEKTKDGKTYIHITWGEDEVSYILESALYENLYGIYTARDCDEKRYFDFEADWIVYESEEEAEKAL